MTTIVPTPALGRFVSICAGETGAGALGVLLLRSAEAETALRTRRTVATLLAASGTTEASWTSGTAYVRKTGISAAIVDGSALVDVDCADQVWENAGTVEAPQDVVRFVLYWRYTADTADTASRVLLIADFPERASGAPITAQIAASGALRASAA